MLSVTRASRIIFNEVLLRCYEIPMPHRTLTMHAINKNLYLCTDKPRVIEVDKESLSFKQVKENSKPLVVMISWFYGKQKSINKYSKFYTDQGMDVLVGNVTIRQTLFSIKSVEKFGLDIADILLNNEKHYPEIFIHTFSAGGSIWGVSQRMMKKNLSKYGGVPKRVIGQIWESVGHPGQALVVIPAALFPKNRVMRSFVTGIVWLHMKLYPALHRNFDNAVDNFRNNLVRSPALVFGSKNDNIVPPEFTHKYIERWQENGVNVTFKCFEDSPHLKHSLLYPEEYLKYVHEHWKLVKLLDRE